MTKERLEELIKQGATIYDKSGYSINLSEKDSFMENILEFYYTIEDNRLLRMQKQPHIALNQWWIKELFETKERAEWALKTVAERTERFEPPMWEDLVTPYQFTIIDRCKKDSRDMGTYTFYVYQSGIFIEEDIEAHAQHYLFDEDFTKENYEKACEIVRDLFKEEK